MADAVSINIPKTIYNPIYFPHLKANHRTQIFYGGAGSGKSVFLAQRCVEDLLLGGRNYLVCRAVQRTIRRSVFTEITKVISMYGVSKFFKINKADMQITCSNGYQILFTGLDDVEKVKSLTPAKGVLTDIWIEEATETIRDAVKQLYKRQRGRSKLEKRLTLSFNPILKTHWIVNEYFPPEWTDDQTFYETDELIIQKTTYKDNKFLTPSDVADLENEEDPYFYNVYTLGNWGILGDLIFKNVEIADLSELIPTFDKWVVGCDFGYSADPAAVIVGHLDERHHTIYLFKELYLHGATNDVLAMKIKELVGRTKVVCDSSEPKSIQELKDLGVNAYGARKGRDSILHGIQWLQQWKIVVHSELANTINEFNQYQWEEDKDGNPIPKPVDKNNHIIDATRYGFEEYMKQAPIISFGREVANWRGTNGRQ